MKAVVRYRGLLTVLTVVVSLGLAGVTPAVAQEAIVDCVSTVWQLTAGQTIPVGAVVVRNDRDNIYVTYNLSDEKNPNSCFGTLHLWGGTDLADVPSNPQGVPVPGQFPYSFDATGLRTHTFTIPIADRLEPACNAALSLFIVSHAEVDLDCNPETDNTETAFGGNQAGGGWGSLVVLWKLYALLPTPTRTPSSHLYRGDRMGWYYSGYWTGLVVLL
jgi:hypothetical protein